MVSSRHVRANSSASYERVSRRTRPRTCHRGPRPRSGHRSVDYRFAERGGEPCRSRRGLHIAIETAFTPRPGIAQTPGPVTRYLSLAEYLWLAGQITGMPAETLVESERIGLAESAVHAPMASFGGEDFYPDMVDKAAVLCWRLARNHPLPDGNKRAAWVVSCPVHRSQQRPLGTRSSRCGRRRAGHAHRSSRRD